MNMIAKSDILAHVKKTLLKSGFSDVGIGDPIHIIE